MNKERSFTQTNEFKTIVGTTFKKKTYFERIAYRLILRMTFYWKKEKSTKAPVQTKTYNQLFEFHHHHCNQINNSPSLARRGDI